MAVKLIESILDGKLVNINAWILELKELYQNGCLGPSTAAIADEIQKMGVPVTRLGEGSLLICGCGACQSDYNYY